MVKQVINVGTSTNDGTGDSLRVGAQKINDNFTELYSSVAYTLPTASTSVKGGVVIDGITTVINDGVLSVTGNGIHKLNTGAVDLTLTADSTTGRLVATGPLIILTGGDGAENHNDNYTQLQWTSDVANPDTSKSQYLWLDTNGISLQTLDPEAYSNTLHYGLDGTLTFDDLGKVGPVQGSNGIDLFANSNMSWAQLNYDNRNFFWVNNTSANIDVLTTENFHWEFTNAGQTVMPGGYTFPLNDGMYISGAITETPDGEGGYNASVGPIGLTAGPYNRNKINVWGNTGTANGAEDWAIELYSDHSGSGENSYFAQLLIGQDWNHDTGNDYIAQAKTYLQSGLSVDLGDIIIRGVGDVGHLVFTDVTKGIIFGDNTVLKSADYLSYFYINGNTDTLQNDVNVLNEQIGTQNNTLDSMNGQLQSYQSQLSYWYSQPDFVGPDQPNYQKYAMVSQLMGMISSLEMSIGQEQGLLSNLTSQLAIAEEGLLNPRLEFYYNPASQQLTINNGANATVKFPNGIVFGDNTVQTTVYTLPTATTSVLGGVKVDGTSIVINNDVISVATVFDQSLNTTNNVEFASVTANSFVSTSAGIPTLTSATNINLTAANAVVVTTSPFRLASLTTTQRDALTAVNGDMIYNSTTNKLQGYQNGTWINLDGTM
jgi:hypothetical protein